MQGKSTNANRREAALPGAPERGVRHDFEFKVFPANLKEEHAEIRATLDAGGTKYSEGYTLVTREDLGSFSAVMF